MSSPSHKLFKRYSILVAAIFVLGSITPLNASSDGSYYSDLEGTWDAQAVNTSFIADQDGYLTKYNPQTDVGDRSTMHDYLVHTVSSGETISTIANGYGLHAATVLWANGMSSTSTIKSGQKLLIPPVDGISHHVAKGEDVKKIAKTYGVSADSIIKQNSLSTDGGLVANEDIFVPGAKPLIADVPSTPLNFQDSANFRTVNGTVVRTTPARVASSSRVGSAAAAVAPSDGAILQGADSTPTGGKPFIFPTRGQITQYFHAGHYAFDIGNRSEPAIWAAADGVVIKAFTGCVPGNHRCGGGYGNHIIIQHPNGLETLYGHMTYLSVNVGDHVTQGEVIGKMGKTGNVYGVTGIHLHWEVHKKGQKLNPALYY